jgi:sulfide dehydrogenase cytochrome subunit
MRTEAAVATGRRLFQGPDRMSAMHGVAATLILLASAGAASAASVEPPAGAAACSGCHAAGANVATPVPRLVGRNAAEIVTQMQAFRDGKREGTIMTRIAKGFTDPEIQAIAVWYANAK